MTAPKIIYRPLSNPEESFGPKVNSPFSVFWSQAKELLLTEVERLGAKEVIIEVDVAPGAIRQDGGLRARTRHESGRVVVSFESKHGPLRYASGRYVKAGSWQRMDSWEANVYAIAKTLESLRAVERYGASASGEQYRGYAQLEAAAPERVDDDAWLERITGMVTSAVGDPARIRKAKRVTHPDHGGDPADFARVMRIAKDRGL